MLSSMDHLFCLRIRHVLILVPASPRDLHRHSCRHFHFHFWLSLHRSYLHFVSRWISFLSPPPSLARAFVRFCFPPLSSVLFFLSFFFPPFPPFFSSLLSCLSLQRAFSFLASAAEYARSRQTRSPTSPCSSIFRESFVLATSSRRPPARRDGQLRENERISSTAPREIDELRTARSNGATKREHDEEM